MEIKDERIMAIMELLMSYARLDFEKAIPVDSSRDELAAIAAGVNMLGEELKENSISLKEKERLLKELHHRVKNNMQIIVSMLGLQTVNETDPKILAFVRDSKSRIDSMALVHEMLYSSEGFEFTKLSEYLDFLQRSIFMSYAPPNHQISVDMQIDEACQFNIDKMIPLGLMINEMFSNTLKHAFPDNKGQIKISASFDQDLKFHFSYSDNGVGLPDQFDISKVESLGMQLIEMLSDQLDADLQLSSPKNQSGLTVDLSFQC